MPARIRLQRHGKKRKPIYHVIIADKRAPRNGKFIEKIGLYNPNTTPATIDIDTDKAISWLNNGAQPSDTVRAMLSFKGILYKKHLLRGVDKGVVKAEDVDKLMGQWLQDKEKRTADQHAKAAKRKADKAKKKAEELAAKKVEEAPAATEVPVGETTEDSPEGKVTEAVATDAPAEEPKTEEKQEDTPAEEVKVEVKEEEPAKEEKKADTPTVSTEEKPTEEEKA